MGELVPAEFDVPRILEHPSFQLRMLTADHARADYDAVMESRQRLRDGSPHGWPRPGFTLSENRQDLERHEAEFKSRIAFAYTMLDPSGKKVLGCVYIRPSATDVSSGNADVYMWVRDSSAETLTDTLFRTVDSWLSSDWPFRRINYIRREYYLSTAAGPTCKTGNRRQ